MKIKLYFNRIFFFTITIKDTIYVINLVYFFLLTDVYDEMNVQVTQNTLDGKCCTQDKKKEIRIFTVFIILFPEVVEIPRKV